MARNFHELRDQMDPQRRAHNRADAECLSTDIDADRASRALKDQPDVTVATLRDAVEAMGGTLEITARFPVRQTMSGTTGGSTASAG